MVPNRSKHLFVFGIFSIRYKDWLTHCGETDKPSELCYYFSTPNDLLHNVNSDSWLWCSESCSLGSISRFWPYRLFCIGFPAITGVLIVLLSLIPMILVLLQMVLLFSVVQLLIILVLINHLSAKPTHWSNTL